jgi:Sulfotransferase domain
VLPNVLVVGAQKCGTTALHRRFELHPDCSVPRGPKEVHFFVDEGPWPIGRWRRGVAWYESLFDPAEVVADVCPSYSAWPIYPGAAARAREVVPDALVVYLVRDPIDRIASHWIHFRSRGYERRPFGDSVLADGPDNEYLAGSRYGTQLGIWLEEYPREQVLVLHQRAAGGDGDEELWRRLGVSRPPADPEPLNVSAEMTAPGPLERLPVPLRSLLPARVRRRPLPRPVIEPDTRARLHEALDADIARFHSFGGVRLEGWPAA